MEFTCKTCNKDLQTKQGLQWHLDGKNSCNPQSFNCTKCDFISTSKGGLQRHLNRKIPCDMTYKCNKCDFIANTKVALNVHQKTPCSVELSKIDLSKIDINDILNKHDKLLTITEILKIINIDIDEIYLDKFWSNIEDDKLINLDNDLISWLLTSPEIMLKLLSKHFSSTIDYIILDNKEILITTDAFKELCLYINTKKSRDIKKYYIQTEKIYKFYNKYINLYKDKQLIFNNSNNNQSYIYITTTKELSKDNIFRVSFIEHKDEILCSKYECIYDKKSVSYILKKYQIDDDLYKVHFTILDNIIKNIADICNIVGVDKNLLKPIIF